jgi:hypothetical protein
LNARYIISLRVEVTLFVLSPGIEDRDEVEVATGRSTKRPSSLNDIPILFYLQADYKKKKSDMNSFIFFAPVTVDSVEPPVDVSTPKV